MSAQGGSMSNTPVEMHIVPGSEITSRQQAINILCAYAWTEGFEAAQSDTPVENPYEVL